MLHRKRSIVSVPPPNRPQVGVDAIPYPTNWALELPIERRLKIEDALRREARRMKFGLYRTKLRLQLRLLVLKGRYALTKLVAYVFGQFAKIWHVPSP